MQKLTRQCWTPPPPPFLRARRANVRSQVLSVVAQQVLDIQRAVAQKLRRFVFEGTEMQLKWSAWCSITMNPGYAGDSS